MVTPTEGKVWFVTPMLLTFVEETTSSTKLRGYCHPQSAR